MSDREIIARHIVQIHETLALLASQTEFTGAARIHEKLSMEMESVLKEYARQESLLAEINKHLR